MNWVGHELSGVQLGDTRLDLRLMMLIENLVQHAEQSVPQQCKNWAETKAAYRFWGNNRIDWHDILQPHTQRTVERAMEQKVVLVLQDHMLVDLTSHSATKGLGYLNSKKTRGLIAHFSMAVSERGVPLGSIDLQMWTRPLNQFGKRAQCKRKKTSEKESQSWINGVQAASQALHDHPQVIVVGDRESDIYDVFAAPRPDNIALLVRVGREHRYVDELPHELRAAVEAAPVAGEIAVSVGRSKERAPREARVAVRFVQLNICPPNSQQRQHRGQQVPLSFVLVEETESPPGEKKIRWLLATTLPVKSLDDAVRVVDWYAKRWLIERFHFTLKSGFGIEEQQLEDVAHIERFIASQAVAAWRVMWLAYESRVHPEQPCTMILDRAEWHVLYRWTHRRAPRPLPTEPPTLGEATRMIARLGGHLGRTSDGPPGVKVLWRGLARLHDLTTGSLLPPTQFASNEDSG